jgi:hypothetical protein
MSTQILATNTTGGIGDDDEEEEALYSAFLTFLVNFGALLCFLLFAACCYCMLLAAITCCERGYHIRHDTARADFITSTLVVREWCDRGDDDDSSSADASSENEAGVEILPVDKQSSQEPAEQLEPAPPNVKQDGDIRSLGEDDESRAKCAICLAAFVNHERVCESNNMSCRHIFHEDCMVFWLKMHIRCPVCRQTYLVETA